MSHFESIRLEASQVEALIKTQGAEIAGTINNESESYGNWDVTSRASSVHLESRASKLSFTDNVYFEVATIQDYASAASNSCEMTPSKGTNLNLWYALSEINPSGHMKCGLAEASVELENVDVTISNIYFTDSNSDGQTDVLVVLSTGGGILFEHAEGNPDSLKEILCSVPSPTEPAPKLEDFQDVRISIKRKSGITHDSLKSIRPIQKPQDLPPEMLSWIEQLDKQEPFSEMIMEFSGPQTEIEPLQSVRVTFTKHDGEFQQRFEVIDQYVPPQDSELDNRERTEKIIIESSSPVKLEGISKQLADIASRAAEPAWKPDSKTDKPE